MAMHNFGPNPLHQQQQQEQQHSKNQSLIDAPWHGSQNLSSGSSSSDQQQQQSQQQQQAHNQSQSASISPLNIATNAFGSRQQHQLQAQYYGLCSPQVPASLQSAYESRVDQIIRNTLHDQSANVMRTNSNNNSSSSPHGNMVSPSSTSSSMIFNPAVTGLVTPTQNMHAAVPISSIGSVSSAASPHTSIYGTTVSSASVDTLNNASGGNGNLSAKTAAHSASHTALAAAAALQSLNQSHLQRSQKQSQHLSSNAATARPPSNPPTPQAAHGNNSSDHMPKLGITSTTSSNHQNHNHFALPSNSNSLADLSARFQGCNNHSNSNKMPFVPPIRPPVSWQDQISRANTSNSGLRYTQPPAHGGGNPSLQQLQQQTNYLNLHNSPLNIPVSLHHSNMNNMIGLDASEELAKLSKFDRHSTSMAINNNPMKESDQRFGESNNSRAGLSGGSPKQIPFSDVVVKLCALEQIENPHGSKKFARTPERLAAIAHELVDTCVPGTDKPKLIVDLDDTLRSCINQGEFYTRFQHLVLGIISNNVLVPGFSLVDYFKRDRFPAHEIQAIEVVHRMLGVSQFLALVELSRQNFNFCGTTEASSHEKTSHLTEAHANFNQRTSIYSQQSMPMFNNPSNRTANTSHMPTIHDRIDHGLLSIDKSRRSTQSPNDLNSRSQFNNTPKSAHSSSFNISHGLTPEAISSNHNLPPSPFSPHRGLLAPQLQAQQPTQFQQPSLLGPNLMNRPTRSHSTISAQPSSNNPDSFRISSSPQQRQPPAAHQSSLKPNLGNIDEIRHAGLPSNTPTLAHLSSKMPQTPKINDTPNQTVKIPSANLQIAPNLRDSRANRGYVNQMSNSQPDPSTFLSKTDIDPLTGLPMQTLLSLRQQEQFNRDNAQRRSNTPHFISPNTPASIRRMNSAQSYDPNKSNMMDPHTNSRSPTSLQMQSLYNNPLTTMSSNGYSPRSNNNNMPPIGLCLPPLDHNQRFGNSDPNKSTNLPAHFDKSLPNIDLKNCPIVLDPNQQQHLQANSTKSGISFGANGQIISNPSMHVNILQANSNLNHEQGGMDPMHGQNGLSRMSVQQTSPKQSSQRSIITGSALASAKKGKKAKLSPSSSAQPAEVKLEPNRDLSNYAQTSQQIPEQESLQTSQPSSEQEGAVKSPVDIAPQAVKFGATAGSAKPFVENAPVGAPLQNNNRDVFNAVNYEHAPEVETKLTTIDDRIKPEPSKPDCNTDNSLTEPAIQTPNNIHQKDLSKVEDSSSSTLDTQPSKYQKYYTKKAWIREYDQEDQTRNTQGASKIDTTAAKEETIKIEPSSDSENKVAKTSQPKSNGAKSMKNSKTDNKKKFKEEKVQRATAANPVRSSRAANRTAENDSEETNASTSDFDESDETDSLKSAQDKKLRRMPRRKVKENSTKETDHPVDKSSKPPREVARKRGKKEKSSIEVGGVTAKRKSSSDDETIKRKPKKTKECNASESEKSAAPKVKREVEKFLQQISCYEIVPKGIRCLECRRKRPNVNKIDAATRTKQMNWDDFCRFYEFRKLRYSKSGQLIVAGFSEIDDASQNDKGLWSPASKQLPENLTYKAAKYIISHIGDIFCSLVLHERNVRKAYGARATGNKKIIWKRAVNGFRELCDVCSTTLFNYHYVCERCGFVVCVDCHSTRGKREANEVNKVLCDEKSDQSVEGSDENGQHEPTEQSTSNSSKKSKKDTHGWIYCPKDEEHLHDKLTLAQIIAGDCLEEIWSMLHRARERLSLGICSCKKAQDKSLSLKQAADLDIPSIKSSPDNGNDLDTESSHSTLKGLLLASNSSSTNVQHTDGTGLKIASSRQDLVDLKDFKQNSTVGVENDDTKVFEFNDDDSQDDSRQVSAAIEECIASLAVKADDSLRVTCSLYDSVALDSIEKDASISSKLCGGNLLVLSQPKHKLNVKVFREHWCHAKPVMVRGVHSYMDIDSWWLPQFFASKFGDYRSDLVDCRNGDIHRQSMKRYWEGFEMSSTTSKKKSRDDSLPYVAPANNEEPSAVATSYYSGSALWRLKDWPPGQDFNEILPEHYNDFMNNLPLKTYTTRTGELNLACRLPKEMLKPDLGPKMYSAYGTSEFPERGTTSLHLDISDAINVMIYVSGASAHLKGSTEYKDIYDKTIGDCPVDSDMKKQIRDQNLIPGALWHIFRPSDAPKMREFLNKVADERKIDPAKRIDPIHDQVWYLDQILLDRLHKEYNVKSFPILQCMGDAILIPAGSPHQVKNLLNCIKVANDFVSPENVRYCLQLTDEFRSLPETHINQEDKLQIKNILYHSVKESLQFIDMHESSINSTSNDQDETTSESDRE